MVLFTQVFLKDNLYKIKIVEFTLKSELKLFIRNLKKKTFQNVLK